MRAWRVLAAVAWLVTPARALDGPCRMNAEPAVSVSAQVRGPATPEEVLAQTQTARRLSVAELSPAYVDLPRIFAYYKVAGVRHGTIAAVTQGPMPAPGAFVTLVSRHRDPTQPCAFVPWTVQPGTVALAAAKPPEAQGGEIVIPIRRRGLSYVVPVTLNGGLTVEFTLDSGSALVQIPDEIAARLEQNGSLGQGDFIRNISFTIADGSAHVEPAVRLHAVGLGGRTFANVLANRSPAHSMPLLGMSFLGRFKSWSIDNARSALILR